MSKTPQSTDGNTRPRVVHSERVTPVAQLAEAAPIAPPQNLEAEQSVLGAVLLSDTALPALIIDERLQPADFYRDSHGLIFTAMLELHGAGEPVDALTLVEHLKQNGQLDAVGGRATVDLLAGSVPAVGNVRQYARIVRENAMLRRLLEAAYEIQANFRVLYNIGRACLKVADKECAARSFEQYLKDGGTDIPSKRRKEVEGELRALVSGAYWFPTLINETTSASSARFS